MNDVPPTPPVPLKGGGKEAATERGYPDLHDHLLALQAAGLPQKAPVFPQNFTRSPVL